MEKETTPQAEKVFINGKAQIIEMLKIMPPDQKTTLLKNLRLKNPQLVEELLEHNVNFNTLFDLNDYEMKAIVARVDPSILGLALKNVASIYQKKVLSMMPRDNAEKTFEIMRKKIEGEKKFIEKAQARITQLLLSLHRNQ